jgi:hypothetical protein
MFTDKANPLRRRNRAVTLIEAVLYISIALALIVGGLVFFQQASTAAKTSRMVREMSAVIAEARVLVKGIPLTDIPTNISAYLISAGAVPPSMVQSGVLYNPFGGGTLISASNSAQGPRLTINTFEVPQGVCARLLTATSGSDDDLVSGRVTTLVSSGFLAAGVAPSSPGFVKFFSMNPTQAGWLCKYGAASYTNKTTEPTSQPISGTVTITMLFWL